MALMLWRERLDVYIDPGSPSSLFYPADKEWTSQWTVMPGDWMLALVLAELSAALGSPLARATTIPRLVG